MSISIDDHPSTLAKRLGRKARKTQKFQHYSTYGFGYVFFSLQRDCGRPPPPRKDPGIKVEEEPLRSEHPYVDWVSLQRKIFFENVGTSDINIAKIHIYIAREELVVWRVLLFPFVLEHK